MKRTNGTASMVARAALAAALAWVALLRAGDASGTTMVKLDLPAMTNSAEAIVAGHVTGSQAAWTSDHNTIYTDVSILVDRSLAGPFTVGQTVVVRCEGGSVDGIGMRVYGAAGFTKNEEVVVFTELRQGHRYVVGMSQGKLSITTDANGVKRISRNLAGVDLLPTTASPRAAAPSLDSITTLDELAAAVQRLRANRTR